MTTSVGFDPEFFTYSKKDMKIVPVCGLLGGTKGDPVPFEGTPEGFGYHEDNVVAELNVPAAEDYYMAMENLTNGINYMTRELKTHGLAIRYQGQHKFDAEDLVDPKAKEFGCDPDLDAYTGGKHLRTNVPDFGNFRFAGGHIHLGGDFKCPAFVVALFADLVLGTRLNSVSEDERKKWYGAPGIFRVKDYGVEYRTPSCGWLKYEDSRYDLIQRAYALCEWLEGSTALQIKKVCDTVEWLTVREFIMTATPSTSRSQIERIWKQARMMGCPT